jgi:hypothetical protein
VRAVRGERTEVTDVVAVGRSRASSEASRRVASVATKPEAAAVLELQRAAGNAATVTMLRRYATSPETAASRMLARCQGPCHCGGRCGVEEQEGTFGDSRDLQRSVANVAGAQLLARAVRERRTSTQSDLQVPAHQTLLRMAACPSRLADSDPTPPGWKPYFGDSSVFHCGYRGILEDRTPTRDDPMNECFYDDSGTLVDANHPHAACGGTPDQYDAREHPILHALIDSGGIVRAGLPAFAESRRHDAQSADAWYRRQRARWFYGAP